MTQFRKGDKLTGAPAQCSYRVLTAHRNGTLTVKALFPLTPEGVEAECGYLGYVYRNQPANLFTPYTEQSEDMKHG